MDITEAQWQVLEPLLPAPTVREDGRGRPWRDPRDVLNGILWILRTGAPWADLPERYPPYQTCHRRFQAWAEAGVMERVLHALARDLQERGGLDLSECFVDATFASAKRGHRHRQDQARQGQQDHGSRRRFWSSCLRMHEQCFAA